MIRFFVTALTIMAIVVFAGSKRSITLLAQAPCTDAVDVQWKEVDYPSGWNLIAGPKGSCLEGATEVYAILPAEQVEATAASPYSTVSDTSMLPSSDYAYWAFFPTGGRALLKPLAVIGCGGVGSFSEAAITPDAWNPVPNPSSDGPATIAEGFSEILLWSPSEGYHEASEIPAGSGAWLLGNAVSGSIQYSVVRC